MSMISGQIDRLRKAAQTYRMFGGHEMEQMLLDAADAITELQAENAKLREELADAPKCEACEAMLDCDECLRADVSHKERRRLSSENAKLRELLQDVAICACGRYCYGCPHQYDGCDRDERLRELGIEEEDA